MGGNDGALVLLFPLRVSLAGIPLRQVLDKGWQASWGQWDLAATACFSTSFFFSFLFLSFLFLLFWYFGCIYPGDDYRFSAKRCIVCISLEHWERCFDTIMGTMKEWQ